MSLGLRMVPDSLPAHRKEAMVLIFIEKAARKPGGPRGHNERADFIEALAEHLHLDVALVDGWVAKYVSGAVVGAQEDVRRYYERQQHETRRFSHQLPS